jgi:dihydropteroate synthase
VTIPAIPRGAKLYLRPEGFVDTPVGNDGQVARLAGTMLWHMAWELIVDNGGRVARALVPVSEQGSLPDEAAPILERLSAPRPPIRLRERVIRFDQPQAAGIVNVTPDSFSDGGRTVDVEAAVAAAFAMSEAGAVMIDVGGESTRPGAAHVWEGDEIARVVPVIERLAAGGLAVSVDTRKAAVMEAALAAGAGLVNDISALRYDDRALEVVARAGCPVILMHHGGREPHDGPKLADPLIEVYDWLEDRIAAAVAAGISRDRIIVDPGIGFGKGVADNLALLNGLALFQGLGCAVMLGASRKRLIGALANEAPAGQRLGGSLALALHGAQRGVQLLRVHDAAETVQAIRVWRGLRDQALTG